MYYQLAPLDLCLAMVVLGEFGLLEISRPLFGLFSYQPGPPVGTLSSNPICSTYEIFTNICPKNQPNVGKYSIHGAYGNIFKVLSARHCYDNAMICFCIAFRVG